MSQSLPPGVSIPGSETAADDAASVATGTTVTTGTVTGNGSGSGNGSNAGASTAVGTYDNVMNEIAEILRVSTSVRYPR